MPEGSSEPVEVLRRDCFATGDHEADRTDVTRASFRLMRGHAADQGRGYAEMGYLVTLHKPRYARPVRCIRRAVVADHRGAAHQGRGSEDRSCDPAHVRRPQETVAFAKVVEDGRVVHDLDREAAVRMNDSLRLSGRA